MKILFTEIAHFLEIITQFCFQFFSTIVNLIIAILMAIIAYKALSTSRKANELIKKSQDDSNFFEIKKVMPIINMHDITSGNKLTNNIGVLLLLENIGIGPALKIKVKTEPINYNDAQEKLTFEVFGWDNNLKEKRYELESFENLIIAPTKSIQIGLSHVKSGDELMPGEFLSYTKVIITYSDIFENIYISELNRGKLEFKSI